MVGNASCGVSLEFEELRISWNTERLGKRGLPEYPCLTLPPMAVLPQGKKRYADSICILNVACDLR
ncbi:hypothetical protein K227x_40800 [Rubripirellula lacrimiformis]|uniref:Uncharacterized protein n=1 Tax=Rubripirellula lacrimiformis TaxID=1930273 RepID=A0A517NF48_9BACT|nr:hypothetical protein K227x_40800 [Rubripirellula lacrimiformis]